MELDAGSTVEGSENAEEKSMDDTIRDTLREIKTRDPEAAAVVSEKTEPAEITETPEAKADRLRDPAGKFAAKSAETVATVQQAEPVAVPLELQKLGLSKEEAAAWATTPKAVQDAFLRRTGELVEGGRAETEKYKTKAQFADAIQSVIAPHMPTIQALGVSPEVAIGELLKADQVLRHGSPEQKQAKFMQLLADYGVQLQGIEQPQIDPRLTAMQQELRQVTGKLQQFETQGERTRQQELNSQIDAFKADPSHKHFDTVRGYMGALIQAGHAPDLQSAYEQAVWANPVTRAEALAIQQEAARTEADQKAKLAREAASANTRNRPTLPAAIPVNPNMDEDIRATYRRLTAVA